MSELALEQYQAEGARGYPTIVLADGRTAGTLIDAKANSFLRQRNQTYQLTLTRGSSFMDALKSGSFKPNAVTIPAVPRALIEFALMNANPFSLLFADPIIHLPIYADGRIAFDQMMPACPHCGRVFFRGAIAQFMKKQAEIEILQHEVSELQFIISTQSFNMKKHLKDNVEVVRLASGKSATPAALGGRDPMEAFRSSLGKGDEGLVF